MLKALIPRASASQLASLLAVQRDRLAGAGG
jgi:hypothetical protein